MDITPDNHETNNAKPALIIQIQSWATPIVGLVMLIIGLAAGYFGRPLVSSAFVKATSTVPAPTAAPAENNAQESEQPPIKDLVVEQTVHFIGDEDAPVTIVEFSDFQ